MDLSNRYNEIIAHTPSLSKIPLFGVVKEIASNSKDDIKLGVHDFHSNYFENRPLYLDHEKNFYALLGNRKLKIPFSSLLTPIKSYNDYKTLGNRLKNKNIEGNMNGEGFLQGGVIIIGPGDDGEIIYKYEEETGSELPLDEIEKGIYQLKSKKDMMK
mmetsp:Transcript_10219/g.12399  ORF Transcript_10219/g.12399 Transcript_10219/m.12399 type:complete len:158 (-) Transcript_10219:339-812(-)